MKSTQVNAENFLIEENDIEPWLFNDFKDWFNETIELLKPNLIVGIARGAIRILQYFEIEKTITSIPVVSNNGLPFIDVSIIRGARIMIFDDSLIFGSTMARIKKYLEDKGGICFCTSYVVDRKNFFGEGKEWKDKSTPSHFSDIHIHFKHKLWPKEIRIHHDLLVRRLLDTQLSYNFDFPSILIKTNPFGKEQIPLLINDISRALNTNEIYDVSNANSSISEIYRFTALLSNPSKNIFRTQKLLFLPHTKVRITISGFNGEIKITPIIQLAISDSLAYDEQIFSSTKHSDLWEKLNKPHPGDLSFKPAMFRLLTFFILTLILKKIENDISKFLKNHLTKLNSCFLDEDVKLNLWSENAQKLHEIYNAIENEDIIVLEEDNTIAEGVFEEKEFTQKDIMSDIIEFWNQNLIYKPHYDELLYEMLGKIFLALRELTDSISIRNAKPNEDRLNVGLSFCTLKSLLNDYCGTNFSINEISLGIDICVDNGQAVPKILKEGDYWIRLFYSGERTQSIDPLQLKNYFYEAYNDFMKIKNSKSLTPFDLHKLSVTLKDILPWLPFSTKFSIYGRIALAPQSENGLLKWLAKGYTSPFIISRDNDKYNTIQLNTNFRSVGHTVWPAKKAREFLDSFEYIARAFNLLKWDQKVYLSTCPTQRHTFNAVAYEVYCWIQKGHYNFDTLLSSSMLVDENQIKSREYLATNIYWCSRYIAEAINKFNIFHTKASKLKRDIEHAFTKQSNSAKRFYKHEIENRLQNDIDSELSEKFNCIIPIIQQMKYLTSYLTELLLAYRFIDLNEIEKKFTSEDVSLYVPEYEWLIKSDFDDNCSLYNQNIIRKILPGLSKWKTFLSNSDAILRNQSIEKFSKTVDTIVGCFDEIRKVVSIYCPEYNVQEGIFPFAPNGNIRYHVDGSTELILNNIYILTMDIIGSTDSPQTDEMKQTILDIIPQICDETSYYEDTGNDAYIVCTDNKLILFDIAKAISNEGERLKKYGGRFGGTRKAITFGTVKIIKRTDGHYIIMDAVTPNIIPSAFSILDAIDKYKKTNLNRNSLISIDSNFIKSFEDQLDINCDSLPKVWIDSKHFSGNCSIYDTNELIRKTTL